MKKGQVYLILFFLSIVQADAQHTFSICAVDTLTGEVGAAGASCVDATMTGGIGVEIISSIHPGYGAIHTQAAYLPANQIYGDSLMNRKRTCKEIVDSLVAHDAQGDPAQRQYGVVELRNGLPSSAGYSGSSCPNYYNQISGRNYSIQGNTLLGARILDSMQARFLRTPGDLACKLMSAMQGAKVVGADSRCASSGNSSLSSFLRVACSNDIAPHFTLNLLVQKGPYGFEPIDSLQKLFNQAHPSCLNPIVCSVTGVRSEPRAEFRAEVFPNPGGDELTIRLPVQPEGQLCLEVFSGEGKLLYRKDSGGRNEWILSESELGKGIFFYHISHSSGKVCSGKFEFQ
ncbi:MAG TPA: DUF1028 domain-containing protein [Bacteroidia bacterium]|nr:DUF1028 domain-containing protein [Bacteroidia bacterium]